MRPRNHRIISTSFNGAFSLSSKCPCPLTPSRGGSSMHSKLRRGIRCINYKRGRVDRNTLRRGTMEISPAALVIIAYHTQDVTEVSYNVWLTLRSSVRRSGASAKVCDRNRHCCTYLSLLAMQDSVLRVQFSCSGAETSGVASRDSKPTTSPFHQNKVYLIGGQ